MAWRVEGHEVLEGWARSCDDFDALFIVLLWLERVKAAGPSPEDDDVNGVAVHVEGAVMIRYHADDTELVLTIVSLIDLA